MKIYNEKRFTCFREIVNYVSKKFDKKTAFQIKISEGKYEEISFALFEEHYYRLCTELLNRGLLGKKIAVSGANCYEWVLCYLAAATVGVAVPIDKELSGEDIESFVALSESKGVFCDRKVFEKLNLDVTTFANVREIVESSLPINRSAVDRVVKGKDEMSVLIFTSGTTGSSKGVMLSQNNICMNIFQTVSMVKILKSDKTMSILPLHHTYECTLDCLLILSRGATICYTESLQTVARNIKEYSPSILVVVPELLAILSRRIKAGIIAGCPEKYKHLFENGSISEALPQIPFIIRSVIKKKVKKTLGGKLRLFIVGAADLDVSIVDDFTALGIRTLQGYGLTETSPLLAGNNDFYFNPRSTGVAIPYVTLKIDNPNEEGVGEIIAKGENIMLGYYNDREATDTVLRDGWFHTGDLGKMDPDGALYIKGRIKNIIVSENGKNIYPEELETRLSEYEEIGDVIVVPDRTGGRVSVKAKIFPNIDFLKKKLGHEPSTDEKESIIKSIVAKVNERVPSYKHIKKIEMLTESLEKTTTRKIKRFGSNVN